MSETTETTPRAAAPGLLTDEEREEITQRAERALTISVAKAQFFGSRIAVAEVVAAVLTEVDAALLARADGATEAPCPHRTMMLVRHALKCTACGIVQERARAVAGGDQ